MYDQIRGFASVIRAIRRDGWENVVTGLGTSRDKTTYGSFRPGVRITDAELSWMFHHHALAKRIVSLRVDETFRMGFQVEIPDSDVAEEVNEEIKKREIVRYFREGKIWGRLFGGCLLIAGIDDGRDMSEPLEDDAPIRSVRYLTLLDKRYCYPASRYEDPESPKYMEVETYQIVTPTGLVLSKVHETRVIRFGGAMTDVQERVANNGWDMPYLQHVYEVLRDFEHNQKSVDHLVSDASQAVIKIKGLLAALATPKGVEAMQTRMQIVDMCRSVARALVLDADAGEDFKREPTNFSGLPEILDRNMMRTSSAAETPVTLLFGRSPAGMNATGESDIRWFYDTIKAEQTNVVEPDLRKAIGWLLRAQDGPTGGKVPEKWNICFPSLWQPTPLEKAQTEKAIAERDKIYIDATVWHPEEVALTRARNGMDAPVEIDEDMREMMLEHEKQMAANPPQLLVNNGAPNPLPTETPNGGNETPAVPTRGSANAPSPDGNPQEDPNTNPGYGG